MRAKGTVVVQTFSRFASFFNQFVNPIGLSAIGWKYYIVYTVWLFIEGLGKQSTPLSTSESMLI